MPKYVDGFVLTVPKKNLPAYKKMAQTGAKLWRKYGAIDYKECVIEDAKPKWIKLTFAKIMKPKAGEVIVFSFIVYKSRKHRDQVNTKVMADPSMSESEWKDKPMPFDMDRMANAGFEVLVDF